MPDELAEHLDALARDDCYRVDAVLKDGALETTQRVYFVGANGAEQGPYVRKYLDSDAGLGAAYERMWKAQRAGRRFLHLPRIVDCYAAGEKRAVVMEYVRGETLADVLYRCDPSVALACDVFPRLCEAVAELHEGFDPPIIHRDLKPSNIMLSKDSLTIIDFGISRTFDDAADEDTRHFGTRAYAPPEQFGYGQTDVRSDVYALGMLLYFCLTEKTPDAKARRGGFRDPRIPEAFRRIVVHATAFDPAQRYASVTELEGCLLAQAAGGTRPLAARGRVRTPRPPTRQAARSPWKARLDAGPWPRGGRRALRKGRLRHGMSMPTCAAPVLSSVVARVGRALRLHGGLLPGSADLRLAHPPVAERGVVWEPGAASLGPVLFSCPWRPPCSRPGIGIRLASARCAHRAFGTAVWLLLLLAIGLLLAGPPSAAPPVRSHASTQSIVETAIVLGCFVLCVLLAGLLGALNL